MPPCLQDRHLKGRPCSEPSLEKINQENNLLKSGLCLDIMLLWLRTYLEMLIPQTYPQLIWLGHNLPF